MTCLKAKRSRRSEEEEEKKEREKVFFFPHLFIYFIYLFD